MRRSAMSFCLSAFIVACGLILVIWKIDVSHISAHGGFGNPQAPPPATDQKDSKVIELSLKVDNPGWNRKLSPRVYVRIENISDRDVALNGASTLYLNGGNDAEDRVKGFVSVIDFAPGVDSGRGPAQLRLKKGGHLDINVDIGKAEWGTLVQSHRYTENLFKIARPGEYELTCEFDVVEKGEHSVEGYDFQNGYIVKSNAIKVTID